jgi:hypothetical protein
MSSKFSEKHYEKIQKELEYYFYDLYWREILELFKTEKIYNAKSPLLDAIRSGKVHYQNGVFTGEFNIPISRELSKLGMKFYPHKKIWKGIPPSNIIAAANVVNDRMRKIAERIDSVVARIPDRSAKMVDEFTYSVDETIRGASEIAGDSMKKIGISIDMTPELSARLTEEYTENMNLYIKQWTDDQVIRLREMVKQSALSGYNRREMERLIASEYNTTMSKAKFLARNETMLFFSDVQRERYTESGVEYYRWSTSNDSRVVGKPGGKWPDPSKGHGNHHALQGKICRFDDPSVFADSIESARKGLWKSKRSIEALDSHPGQDFLCRCVAIPVKA